MLCGNRRCISIDGFFVFELNIDSVFFLTYLIKVNNLWRY